MNVFGFLTAVIFCVTFVLLRWFAHKYPLIFHFRITKDSEQVKDKTPVDADKNIEVTEEANKIENEVAAASMDAVIQAANELMGIKTVDKEDTDAR